jgi:hypothetical protein
MEDRRVALMRARIAAHLSEVARLEVAIDAVVAARAAGVSSDPMLFRGWAELPKPLLAKVLERLHWEPAACGAVRAVCSAWGDVHDEYCPEPRKLRPRHSLTVMESKLAWFSSVLEVDLMWCEKEDVSGVLAELRSMPSLRTLTLPEGCAARAVDAEAVCGLTTLTTLRFYVELGGDWVLDLSRLTTLTSLDLERCLLVTDKQVLELSNLTGLTGLGLGNFSRSVTSEGLRAVSSLTALTTLSLDSFYLTTEGLRAVSSLTALTTLNLRNFYLTSEVLQALSSLSALSTLNLFYCNNLTSEGLQTLSSLSALSTLNLRNCFNVTAAAMQALRTAIPNLTIVVTLRSDGF